MKHAGGFDQMQPTSKVEPGECGVSTDRKHHFTSPVPLTASSNKMSCKCACGSTAPALGGPGAWRCKTK